MYKATWGGRKYNVLLQYINICWCPFGQSKSYHQTQHSGTGEEYVPRGEERDGHCRWHRIHTITPNHSIYDVTSTSGMTSHTLYQTLHPLYLCHHNLSTDITPTFEWHHTHLLCDIISTIYNATSSPYVITLLYLWHHNLYIWNHIQYVGQHIHYTRDITATICVRTPTV